MGDFYFNYAMLVVNSFGLQNALERSTVDIGHFFSRCHSVAMKCAKLVLDELGPQGFLHYSPDGYFVQCSYVVLSLLKLTRPAFRAFIDDEQKTFAIVRHVAELLEGIAAGPMHTPALYGSFLHALLSSLAEGQSGPEQDVNKDDEHQRLRVGIQVNSPQYGGQPQGSQNDMSGFSVATGGFESSMAPSEFQFNGEMGPAMDISTFPPTMAPVDQVGDASGILTMDSILSSGFWDSVLVPGYSNTLEGMSGGFVYGPGVSGLITSRLASPAHSGANTPMGGTRPEALNQSNINAAFATRPEPAMGQASA